MLNNLDENQQSKTVKPCNTTTSNNVNYKGRSINNNQCNLTSTPLPLPQTSSTISQHTQSESKNLHTPSTISCNRNVVVTTDNYSNSGKTFPNPLDAAAQFICESGILGPTMGNTISGLFRKHSKVIPLQESVSKGQVSINS